MRAADDRLRQFIARHDSARRIAFATIASSLRKRLRVPIVIGDDRNGVPDSALSPPVTSRSFGLISTKLVPSPSFAYGMIAPVRSVARIGASTHETDHAAWLNGNICRKNCRNVWRFPGPMYHVSCLNYRMICLYWRRLTRAQWAAK